MRKVLVAAVIMFVLAVMVLSRKGEEGFRITVHNHLDQEINQLTLVYPKGSQIFKMEAHSEQKLHVMPKNFGEGSITLLYEDKLTKQEITIFGYIENNYRGKADVTIDSKAENGELQVAVKTEDHLY
ncbi:hypothetical protein [Paenibacillus sp. JDR-2]|uniref:hypothetical protein n=1 Tax=Paenibacillus sp. (strain JDR-2) TaxID=324057 RepID=UPI000166C175|nr:hypothetical protein [Paenibacillus sp. JDR-2]ACT01468.1 hypothetical protein Pjdr2_2816 [Paenibacillus sp. JDR-2]